MFDQIKKFSPDNELIKEVGDYKEKPSLEKFKSLMKLVQAERTKLDQWNEPLRTTLNENNTGWRSKEAIQFYSKITGEEQIRDYRGALDICFRDYEDLYREQPSGTSFEQHANNLHQQMEWGVKRFKDWTIDVQSAQNRALNPPKLPSN